MQNFKRVQQFITNWYGQYKLDGRLLFNVIRETRIAFVIV